MFSWGNTLLFVNSLASFCSFKLLASIYTWARTNRSWNWGQNTGMGNSETRRQWDLEWKQGAGTDLSPFNKHGNQNRRRNLRIFFHIKYIIAVKPKFLIIKFLTPSYGRQMFEQTATEFSGDLSYHWRYAWAHSHRDRVHLRESAAWHVGSPWRQIKQILLRLPRPLWKSLGALQRSYLASLS